MSEVPNGLYTVQGVTVGGVMSYVVGNVANNLLTYPVRRSIALSQVAPGFYGKCGAGLFRKLSFESCWGGWVSHFVWTIPGLVPSIIVDSLGRRSDFRLTLAGLAAQFVFYPAGVFATRAFFEQQGGTRASKAVNQRDFVGEYKRHMRGVSAWLLSVATTAVLIGTLNYFRSNIGDRPLVEYGIMLLGRFIIGYPVSVAQSRMIADFEGKKYGNVFDTLKKIKAEEGWQGWFGISALFSGSISAFLFGFEP